MGRKRKQSKQKLQQDESDYDSDDPRSYKNEKRPDPSSREYFYDKVDEFNEEKTTIPLDAVGMTPADSNSENEEEVLGWDDDDSDEEFEKKVKAFQKHHQQDKLDSDLEDEKDVDEGPATNKWGRNKHIFYNTDVVGDNIPGQLRDDQEAVQVEEEAEALVIQRRMAQALDEQDFDMDLFQAPQLAEDLKGSDIERDGKVVQDLSKLSKREKLEILRKESPEFLELVEDFKSKLEEVKDTLHPILKKIERGELTESSSGADYIKTKYHLLLSYCLNINFYLILKAKHIPIKNHPVIGRILTFRKLVNELSTVDEAMKEEIERLLNEEEPDRDNKMPPRGTKFAIEDRNSGETKKLSSLLDEVDDDENMEEIDQEEISDFKESTKTLKKTKTKKPKAAVESKGLSQEDQKVLSQAEQEALQYYEKMAALQKEKKLKAKEMFGAEDEEEKMEEDALGEEAEEPEDEDAKRAITYQISKNKGLTARKRKELRNPRVRHRMKFKKAKIRRKGQVREVRAETHRYDGEQSGIRAGIIKSVKIK